MDDVAVNTTRRHFERGFMLVLVLLVLALVSTLLLSLSRGSLSRATRARDATMELQRRWGAATLAASLLPDAGNRLRKESERLRTPMREWRGGLTLGEVEFTVVLADEQSKANLNMILSTDPDGAIRVTRTLLPRDVPASAIDLRPSSTDSDDADAATPAEPPLASWGQVLSDRWSDPRRLLGFDTDRDAINRLATLWGDGRLNLATADRAALAAVAGPSVPATQIDRILEARDTQPFPQGNHEVWLSAAELADQDRARLTAQTTVRSTCHSIAIEANDPWRSHYFLQIMDRSATPGTPDAEAEPAATTTDRKGRLLRFVW